MTVLLTDVIADADRNLILHFDITDQNNNDGNVVLVGFSGTGTPLYSPLASTRKQLGNPTRGSIYKVIYDFGGGGVCRLSWGTGGTSATRITELAPGQDTKEWPYGALKTTNTDPDLILFATVALADNNDLQGGLTVFMTKNFD